MALYENFSTDPGSNNKAPPLGAPEGAVQFKVISDTLRVLMASDAEIGTLAEAGAVTASETVAGHVERATQAEVLTGTDTTRYVSPATLAALTATEVRKGLVETATTAETATGTDATRAVTPAGLAGNITKANPGMILHPGGLIERMGFTTTQTGGTRTITYAAAFSTVVISIHLEPLGALDYGTRVTQSQPSGFEGYLHTMAGVPAPAGITFFWRVIGY